MVYELSIVYPLTGKPSKLLKKASAIAKKYGFLETESLTDLVAKRCWQRFESTTVPEMPTIQRMEQHIRVAIPKLEEFGISKSERPLNEATHWTKALAFSQDGRAVAIQRREHQSTPVGEEFGIPGLLLRPMTDPFAR